MFSINLSTALLPVIMLFIIFILFIIISGVTGDEDVSDYLAVTLSGGKPEVYLNLGTGHLKLTVDRTINDGTWHHIDITKTEKVCFSDPADTYITGCIWQWCNKTVTIVVWPQ